MDDMVQDVVDCLAWVHANINTYGGDKVCKHNEQQSKGLSLSSSQELI